MTYCLYLLSLLLLPTALSLSISVTPSIPVVNNTVTVSCTGNLSSDLSWSFNMIGEAFINLTDISSYPLSNSSTADNQTLTWSIVFRIPNAGDYMCQSRVNGTLISNATVRLITGIIYWPTDDNDTAVDEYSLRFDVKCLFQSAPPDLVLTATWCFQPYVFPSLNDKVCIPLLNNTEILPIYPTQNLTANNFYTSTVRISNVAISNSGIYRCVLDNGFSNATRGFRVRVRGQLEPLWPAIGIILQLIIVTICIVIHYIWDHYKDKQKEIARQEKKDQNLVTSDEQKSNDLLIKVVPT